MNTTDFLPSEFADTSIEIERAAEWEQAARFLDLENAVLARIRQPEVEVTSLHMSRYRDGSVVNAPLHCVLQHAAPAPRLAVACVGEHVTLATMRTAASELSLQMAMLGASGSGAAIGLRTSPASLDEQELWRLAYDSAAFVQRVSPSMLLLPDSLPAAAFALWSSAATARSGGSQLRVAAEVAQEACANVEKVIASGVKPITELALLARGKELRGAKVAVQSCGTLGRRSIQILVEAGARIVAVADTSGGVIYPRGLDSQRLLNYLENSGLLLDYDEGDHVTNAGVLASYAEVLILAGGQSDLTAENADSVNASVVVELAGSSVTPGAARRLADKGTLFVPGLMAGCTRALSATILDPDACLRPVSSWEPWVDALLRDLWTKVMTLSIQHDVPFYRAPLIAALNQAARKIRALHPF